MTIPKERFEQIEAIPDKEIDYTDIPQTDKAFWEKAELRMPQPKKGVYLRLDQDLLDWLKRQGPGYRLPLRKVASKTAWRRTN